MVDWTESQNIIRLANEGNFKAPDIYIGQEAYRYYTDEQRKREEYLQTQAFGDGQIDYDYDRARERATTEILLDEEDASVLAAKELMELGAPTEEVKNVLYAPTSDPDMVNQYSLEKLAVDNQIEDALENNESLRSFEENSPVDRTADLLLKSQIIQSFASNSAVSFQDASLMKKAGLIVERMLPIVDRVLGSRANPLEAETSWLQTTERLEQQSKLYQFAKEATPEEFVAVCLAIDNRLKRTGVDELARSDFWKDMAETPGVMTDIGMGLDIFGIAKGFRKIFSSGKATSAADTAIATGNQSKWKAKAKELISKSEKTQEEVEDLEKLTKPTMMQPEDIKATQGTASRVEDVVDEAVADKAAYEEFNSVLSPELMSQEDIQRSIEGFKEQYTQSKLVAKQKGKKKVYDYVSFNPDVDNKGNVKMIVELGGGSEGTSHFVSEEAAQAYVNSNTKLLKGEYQIVQDSEGYLVRAKYDVPPAGLLVKDWSTSDKPFKAYGIERIMFGRKNLPDWVHNQDVTTVKAMETKRKILEKNFLSKTEKLSSDELKALDTAVTEGIDNAKWLKDEELLQKGFNSKQVDAYHALKNNDYLNYLVSNNSGRREMVKKGMRSVSIDGEKFLAKVANREEIAAGSSFRDFTTKTVYNPGEMTDKLLDEILQDQNKIVVKFNSTVDNSFFKQAREAVEEGGEFVDTPIKYAIVNKEAILDKPLPRFVMSYLPGGRRIYAKGTAFLKQARTYRYAGTRQALLTPKTIFADTDISALREQAKEINGALDIYRNYKEGSLTREIASARLNSTTAGNKYFNIGNIEEMEEYIKTPKNPKGIFEWQHPVEVVEDGKELETVRRLRAQGAIELDDKDQYVSNMFMDLVDTNNTGFWRRSQNPLKTFDGRRTPVVDFKEQMRKTINNTVYLDTQKNYTEWYARRFKELFADVIDPADLRSMSDSELLQYGRIIDVAEAVGNKGLRNKINAARTAQGHWKMIGQVRSDWDITIDTWMTHLANIVGDTNLAKSLGLFQRGSKSYDALATFDPQAFSRAMMYHLTLGMWNPRQLWLQSAGTGSVLMLEPVFGSKAASMYMTIHSALKANPEQLTHLYKNMSKTIRGISKEDFMGLVEYLKRTGAGYAMETSSAYQSTKALSKLTNSSTYFVRGAENFNSIVAHTASFLKWKAKNPNVKLTDDIARSVLGYGDDLYLNMTRASNSYLQTSGWTRSIAQFSAYPLRNIEAMLGKQFTAAQKTSLLLNNLLLYGLEGTIGYSGYNTYKWLTDKGVDPEIAEGFRGGVLDWALRELGMDISVREVGPQVAGNNLFGKLVSLFSGEDFKLLENIPATYALKSVADAPDVLRDVIMTAVNFVKPDGDEEKILTYLLDLSKRATASSLRNGTRAYLAYKTGTLLNSRYDVIKNNMDLESSIYYALGFKTQEESMMPFIYDSMADTEKVAKDLAADAVDAWNVYVRSGSEQALVDFNNLNNALNEHLTNCDSDVIIQSQKAVARAINGVEFTPLMSRQVLTQSSRRSGASLQQRLINNPSIKEHLQ